MKKEIRLFLETCYLQFNRPDFIENDPISIPHAYTKKEDIEIIGFLVALISWGQRKSIINSGNRLSEIFDNSPYDFILNHTVSDLEKCKGFVHRTFNFEDLLSLVSFLHELYKNGDGLEIGFSQHLKPADQDVYNAIAGFRKLYENSSSCLPRTLKHLASPERGSACKRINMFLRWMVRKDQQGVDFGLWKSIKPSQLICPLDVHVIHTAVSLGLINDSKGDWSTASALTQKLRKLDPEDPVRFDFALFGAGISAKMNVQLI